VPTLRNKTKKPLRVPLPGGKTLHLGPVGEGEVSPKALEHPPLQKLIDEGSIEVLSGGRRSQASGGGAGSKGAPQKRAQGPNTGLFQAGDR